jgi:mono/diheme cytochrome c family protein
MRPNLHTEVNQTRRNGRFLFVAVGLIIVFGALVPLYAQQDAATIRAGRSLATSKCFACHDVSPGRAPPPMPGPGVPIPGFQEIANRPNVTAEWLTDRMGTATWHIPALPQRRLPMSHLSDREKSEVAAFILSLREHR